MKPEKSIFLRLFLAAFVSIFFTACAKNDDNRLRATSPESVKDSVTEISKEIQASLFSTKKLTKDEVRDRFVRLLEQEEIELRPAEKGWIAQSVQKQNENQNTVTQNTISEIRKWELKKAIPDDKNEEPFLQSLADFSKELELSLKWVTENPPLESLEMPRIGDFKIATFQITMEQTGLVKDLLRFLTELKRLSRKVHVVEAKIERTDVRDGVEIGKGTFVLEAYYLE